MRNKYTYEEVKKIFENGGCDLLSLEYINSNHPLLYKCSCENISIVYLHNFLKGVRCQKCKAIKQGNRIRRSYEEVYKIFESKGCQLLEKEYKGKCHDRLKFKCFCGNISHISLSNILKGHLCRKCGHERGARNRTYTYKEVKKYFENRNCILLSKEYRGCEEYLQYKCSCGDITTTTFQSFKIIKYCKKCNPAHQIGIKNCNYRKDIPYENRFQNRNYMEYKKWRQAVYKRDNYICRMCNDKISKKIAHHIESYLANKELRTEVSNGITLCKDCHRKFHNIYGKITNKKQFQEFIKKYKNKKVA